jgi:radical SAM/Cys-rich protein
MINEFDREVRRRLPDGLKSRKIGTLQINIGRNCNLSCGHCHLECSPHRTEMMSWTIMEKVLALLDKGTFSLVDITGGSPELHPDLARFVSALRDRGQAVQVRTNLAVLTEPSQPDLISFFRGKEVGLVGSMPCYLEENVNAQRGPDVYRRSIAALHALNEAGYGIENGLPLTLVYNPGGSLLPPDQSDLEDTYREELKARFGISFNRLIALTNMPLGRFRHHLEQNGEMPAYMALLKSAFNAETLTDLMCRCQISIDWDGTLYDCDFNLAVGLTVDHGAPQRIEDFDYKALENRQIITGNHCFGCTAGAGSSCTGSLTTCRQ